MARHCRRAPAVFLLLISDPWRPHPREEGEKRQSHDPQAAHARPPGLLIVRALLYARAGAVRRGVGGHGGRASVLSLEPLPLGPWHGRVGRASRFGASESARGGAGVQLGLLGAEGEALLRF